MGLSFADLLTQESIATIRARIRQSLADDGFPVDSWAPSAAGGVENMRLDMAAGIGAYAPPRIVALVNGRILPLATGDYLKALGKKFYGLEMRGATFTIENLALYAAPGAQVSYTFNPGDLWVRSNFTGNRYQSITGGQFSAANTGPPTTANRGNALMVQFQAEKPGKAYSDGPGKITSMVTARAGVRCINIAPSDFTAATLIGTSTGNVQAVFAGPDAPAYKSIRIRIDLSGNIGSATFSYSLDNGAWVGAGPIPMGFNIIFPGTELFFSNSMVNPSFIAGDIFTMFQGDCILQRGADAETEVAFRRRCANRWPSLSDVPVGATINLWAHNASDEVDKVSADADPNTSGGIRVTIASATGPASPAAQIAVEDYIRARLRGYKGVPAPATAGFTSPTETVSVVSATEYVVAVGGPVRVPKAILATTQVAANVNWLAYLADLPLGGQAGAVIERAKLAQILADAGAVDIGDGSAPDPYSALIINGVAHDIPIPTGSVAVPFPGTSLQTSMIWIPI